MIASESTGCQCLRDLFLENRQEQALLTAVGLLQPAQK